MSEAAYTSNSPEETRNIARNFAREVRGGDVVLLLGDLGLGKTCFVQGLAEGLGWVGAVLSPTFAILQEYETRPPLAHADLYRLETPGAVFGLGLEELTEAGFILAVEWPSRCPDAWPDSAWRVELTAVANHENARTISIRRNGDKTCR
ncbi:MAG: tRNA (adenosine(37)-N6)-threonylcarbamoyltransferase complex ATPase subunit type 1 TsaE [Verrucomicrobia bacterium]|nr:tRNA (adenosine(37)-N6)-threonylcarbamoyltransferase complex ATPase subunit type 1 TsaE [Verrucomicrobiota bacterium]MCH8526699.1 tRNA (adenosine(37)-N6)-threonylcarbamoyltransferase complex ATPase subunit type 1 TsaE [Kiritimatiellia bacterium]